MGAKTAATIFWATERDFSGAVDLCGSKVTPLTECYINSFKLSHSLCLEMCTEPQYHFEIPSTSRNPNKMSAV